MMKQTKYLLLLIIVVCTHPLLAQPAELDTLHHKERLTALIVGTTAAYAGTIIYLSNQWYSEFDRQNWQFFNDAGEWKQVDKAGHVYGAFQLQRLSYQTFQWAGLNNKKSLLWSGVSSFTYMATIEILDGFSAGYGASVSDLVANTVGIGLYTGQRLLWNDIKIHPKFSFRRTNYAPLRPNVLGSTALEEVLKDYNGQSYWLSADLSKFISGRFPRWLNFSVGYGAEGMVYAEDEVNHENGYRSYRQWFIGIDFDVSNVRTQSKFVNSLLFFVNMIRIPAPTLEFSNGDVTWHWIYY